ncbi:AAA family ATPase [Oscillatoria laete-virens NRMC-F 0139]|nr:AAA family ATPase [Oscillatoria laete-virens]MDL5052027.1 AAA family ATPase [Oscillatoria laete-virens NRMC-F 0139]
MPKDLIFEHLSPGVGIGSAVPQNWLSIRHFPIMVFVGMTGVGKSTLTRALSENGLDFTLLPNRRALTERLILEPMLKKEGKIAYPHCRIQRLKYTRLYREAFPGGMGHILSSLSLNPQVVKSLLVFDSLRGENEVRYAAKALNKAQFIFLTAPNLVRLQRLLGRRDPFDKIGQAASPVTEDLTSFASLGLPEAAAYFTPQEETELFNGVKTQAISSTDLRDKLKIFLEESRHYQSLDRPSLLAALGIGDRALIIDTTLPAHQSAQTILAQLPR